MFSWTLLIQVKMLWRENESARNNTLLWNNLTKERHFTLWAISDWLL